MTNDKANEAHKALYAHEAHSEPGERSESNEPEDEPLADAIEDLRTEAEQIEEAVWTNSRVLGKDNVWVYRVNERLRKRIAENIVAIKKLENKSRKRKVKESE